MALAIDHIVSVDNSTDAGTATTASFSTAANVALFAFTTATTSSIGDTITVSGAGLTWVLVRRTNTQFGSAEIWRSQSTAALSSVTVTATCSKVTIPRDVSLTVVSFTGADLSGTNGSAAVGAVGTGSNSGSAPSISIVTTRDNSWVWGVGEDNDNHTTRTLGAGQTSVHEFLDLNDSTTHWVQRQTNVTATSGTTTTINDISPTVDQWNMSTVEILPATGSPASPVTGNPIGLFGYTYTLAGSTGEIKVWNGSSFMAKPVKVWNGSSWVTKPVKRWNGSSWITTTY